MRAPFQVLVLPYRKTPSGLEYAILRQSDSGYWEFVSGGGEDTEKPFEAAKRETEEEIGIIAEDVNFMPLDSQNTQPKSNFAATYASSWSPDVYVIPEYCFAIDAEKKKIILSGEHTEYRWVDYDSAQEKLQWDSNKNALWELNERLTK
jgi:dATP pyrophosphohydrolase